MSSVAGARTPVSETITSILRTRNQHVGESLVVEDFSGHIQLARRLLGVVPNVFPVLSHSPSTLRALFSLHCAFFNAPWTDLRLPLALSPSLRRTAFHAATTAVQCSYCTAHALALGDVLRGSALDAPHKSDENEARVEAVRAFASAAAQRPPMLAEELRELSERVRKTIPENAADTVKTVVCMAGFLNTLMQEIGAEVEPELLPIAEAAKSNEIKDIKYKSIGLLDALRELARVAFNAFRALTVEEPTLFKSLPSHKDGLVEWAGERIGAPAAKFLSNVKNVKVVRAFCAATREMLFPEDANAESDSGKQYNREAYWNSSLRVKFLECFAKESGSEGLACAVDKVRQWERDHQSEQSISREERQNGEVALLFVSAAAQGNSARVPEELTQRLCCSYSPKAVVELAGLVAFFETWRRMCLLFTLEERDTQPLLW